MYDAIVIGARCAGSPTAMLLARMGYRVLLVDRSSFPSDTISTHYIHIPGVRRLEQWGLLGQIFAGVLPFMAIQLAAIVLLYLFPQIGLWLPAVLYG